MNKTMAACATKLLGAVLSLFNCSHSFAIVLFVVVVVVFETAATWFITVWIYPRFDEGVALLVCAFVEMFSMGFLAIMRNYAVGSSVATALPIRMAVGETTPTTINKRKRGVARFASLTAFSSYTPDPPPPPSPPL